MAHKVQPSELLMLLPHFLYRPAALKNQSVLYDKKKLMLLTTTSSMYLSYNRSYVITNQNTHLIMLTVIDPRRRPITARVLLGSLFNSKVTSFRLSFHQVGITRR